jgi:hypothetical protein
VFAIQSFARAIVLVLLFAAAAAAQVGAGALTGIVRDQTGATLPGATLTITDPIRGWERSAVSSSDGVYTVASLPPGTYHLAVDLSGF